MAKTKKSGKFLKKLLLDESVTKRKFTSVKETSIVRISDCSRGCSQSDCSGNATYNELHQKARKYYHIPESSETYLATFYGKKSETGFKKLETYHK